MALKNREVIDIKVAEFSAMLQETAPAPGIVGDRPVYNDVLTRAFACGAEWANLPETEGDEGKAIVAITGALVGGFKAGLAIRALEAGDDSVLEAIEIY